LVNLELFSLASDFYGDSRAFLSLYIIEVIVRKPYVEKKVTEVFQRN
jgi:hypothetical protein